MAAATVLEAAQVVVLLGVAIRILYLGVSRPRLLRRKTVALSVGTAVLFALAAVTRSGVIIGGRQLLVAQAASVLAGLLLALAFLGPVARRWQTGLLVAFYVNVFFLVFAVNAAVEGSPWPWVVFPVWQGALLCIVLAGLWRIWRTTGVSELIPLLYGVGLLLVAVAAREMLSHAVVSDVVFLASYVVFGWGVLGLVDFEELSREQEIFRIAYMPEDIGSKSKRKWKLAPGTVYLVQAPKEHPAFRIFADQVTHGLAGLIISRQHPRQIKKTYPLTKTPMYWLSDTHPDHEDTVPPKPERLFNKIEHFISDDDARVILLDGLEFLASHTTFELTLHFVARLRDAVADSKTRIIIPIDPDTFTNQQRNLLAKEVIPYPLGIDQTRTAAARNNKSGG